MKKDVDDPIEVADKYFFQYLVAFAGIHDSCNFSFVYNCSLCLRGASIKIASLLSFSVNVAYGWTSPTIPLLKDPVTSPIPISSEEGSWIVAIYVIGTIAGM